MHIARLADSFLTQAYGSETPHHAAGGFSNCVGSDHLTPLENARASQPCTEAGDASPSVGKGIPSLLETGDQHSQAGVDSKRRRELDAANDSDLDALRPKRFRLAPAQSSPADISEPQTNDPPHVMTRGELCAIHYMYRVLASSVWTFVLGWLVEDDQVRLIYGDRMGLVFTKTFSSPEDARGYTLPVVSVMGFVGVGNLGLDKSFGRATLPRDGSSQGAWRNHELEFDVDQDEPMHIPSGLLGRGTLVVPITAPPGGEAAQLCGSEPLVAKIAWPQVALHQAEDQTIIVVRRKLVEKSKKYCDHIVDLKCSVTRSIEEMSLPRCAMGVILENEDLRVCRTMVLERYECLEDIGSADAFHTVFVDVVRAHYWVHKTSGILHGDISINNLMWCLRDGRFIGIQQEDSCPATERRGGNQPRNGLRNSESPAASPGVRLANHPEKSELDIVETAHEAFKPLVTLDGVLCRLWDLSTTLSAPWITSTTFGRGHAEAVCRTIRRPKSRKSRGRGMSWSHTVSS
ncbi:uncharacterized protein B0H18DRAFT_1009482 [Fomitopsis serialis]|uniref:uncharacterized protein n=1 Tax=Fomitopsis serialis TaxID=139415 RepID=UPI00200791D8|nr:uncharacterized protein B0H18DRAFT_1009482 [Neoantrodia serialis]KAH9925291.1 hypothetical protein B0H18DRAFT_1009482 [Neoantrodia serialis]